MNVEVHIGEIVLVGMALPPGGEAQLRKALQHELAARLTTAGPSARLIGHGHTAQMSTPAMALSSAQPSPAELGRDLSAALHQGLVQ